MKSRTQQKSALAKPGDQPAAANVGLSLFGKHPGWDDHMPGMGLESATEAGFKQALYLEGIGGQIDAGSWDRLAPENRLEGFDHLFLFIEGSRVNAGRIWSSRDGKGRTSYPLIASVSSEAMSAEEVVERAEAELPKLRDRLGKAETADQVLVAWRSSLFALRLPTSAQGSRPVLSGDWRNRLLGQSSLGPDRVGLQRIMHELAAGVGRGDETRGARARRSFKPFFVRLPSEGHAPAAALLAWAEFLRVAIPGAVPMGLVARAGQEWIDVIVSTPIAACLYCLQAGVGAVPVSSTVTYNLTPRDISWTEECLERFLRVGEAAAGEPPGRMVPVSSVASKGAGNGLPEHKPARGWRRNGVGIIACLAALGAVAVYLMRTPTQPDAQPTINEWSERLALVARHADIGDYDRARRDGAALVDTVATSPMSWALPEGFEDRLSALARRVEQEESQLLQLSNWLAQTEYLRALDGTNEWPGNPAFSNLLAQAEAGRSGRYLAAMAGATDALADGHFDGAKAQNEEAARWQLAGERVRTEGLLAEIQRQQDLRAAQSSWSQRLAEAEQSLGTGDYSLVRSEWAWLGDPANTAGLEAEQKERLDALGSRLQAEESRLQQLSNWVAQADYRRAVDGTNGWPVNRAFSNLLAKAEEGRAGKYEEAMSGVAPALEEGNFDGAAAAVGEARLWQSEEEQAQTEVMLAEIASRRAQMKVREGQLQERQVAYAAALDEFQEGRYTEATAALAENRTDAKLDTLQFDELRERVVKEAKQLEELERATSVDPFQALGLAGHFPGKAPFTNLVGKARGAALTRVDDWLKADDFERVLEELGDRSYAGFEEFKGRLELPRVWEQMRLDQAAGRTNDVKEALARLSAEEQKRKPFQELAEWVRESKPDEGVVAAVTTTKDRAVNPGETTGRLDVDKMLLIFEIQFGVRDAPQEQVINGRSVRRVNNPAPSYLDLVDRRLDELEKQKLTRIERDRIQGVRSQLRLRVR